MNETQTRATAVVGSRGKRAAAAPTAQAGAHGQRWILLTGLVPIKEQSAEFRNKLQNAAGYDAVKDAPEYKGFFIERAEVGPGQSGQPKWSNFYYTNTMKEAAGTWTKSDAEVVDAKYVNPQLCSPLPPVGDHHWGLEVAYPPQIALKHAEKKAAAPKPAAAVDDGTGSSGSEKTAEAKDQPEEKEIDFLLFRFFDFDVKPGKQYRYRVFLVVKNPNYGIEPKYLLDSEFANSYYLGKSQETRGPDGRSLVGVKINEEEGKWSEPSPAIAVPDDIQVLAASVKAPRAVKQGQDPPEIKGAIRVVKWIEHTGVKAWDEFPVVRGKSADFLECRWPHSGVKKPGTKDQKEGSILVNYITGELVLDLDGGDELNPKDKTLTRPGELLVMDKTGHLVIHDELTDQETFDQFRQGPAEAKDEEEEEPAPEKPAGHGEKATKSRPAATDDLPDDIFDNPKKKSGKGGKKK